MRTLFFKLFDWPLNRLRKVTFTMLLLGSFQALSQSAVSSDDYVQYSEAQIAFATLTDGTRLFSIQVDQPIQQYKRSKIKLEKSASFVESLQIIDATKPSDLAPRSDYYEVIRLEPLLTTDLYQFDVEVKINAEQEGLDSVHRYKVQIPTVPLQGLKENDRIKEINVGLNGQPYSQKTDLRGDNGIAKKLPLFGNPDNRRITAFQYQLAEGSSGPANLSELVTINRETGVLTVKRPTGTLPSPNSFKIVISAKDEFELATEDVTVAISFYTQPDAGIIWSSSVKSVDGTKMIEGGTYSEGQEIILYDIGAYHPTQTGVSFNLLPNWDASYNEDNKTLKWTVPLNAIKNDDNGETPKALTRRLFTISDKGNFNRKELVVAYKIKNATRQETKDLIAAAKATYDDANIQYKQNMQPSFCYLANALQYARGVQNTTNTVQTQFNAFSSATTIASITNPAVVLGIQTITSIIGSISQTEEDRIQEIRNRMVALKDQMERHESLVNTFITDYTEIKGKQFVTLTEANALSTKAKLVLDNAELFLLTQATNYGVSGLWSRRRKRENVRQFLHDICGPPARVPSPSTNVN